MTDTAYEVVLTNGKPLVAYACDADYRARAIAAYRSGADTMKALMGKNILDMRVCLRPVPPKRRGRALATAQRHREGQV